MRGQWVRSLFQASWSLSFLWLVWGLGRVCVEIGQPCFCGRQIRSVEFNHKCEFVVWFLGELYL